ncbi:unnamed protein product, partial [Iphiclides podalirius]
MIKTRAARRKELEGTQDQPQQSADEKPKSDGGPTDILEKGIPVKYPPSEKSRRSSSSSIRAQRHKLELEAAKEKARIQMELIDKKLAADLNNLEYSSRSSRSHTNEEVERWLERSQQLEQPAPEDALTTGGLCPPATENATTGNAAAGNDYGTVQMLASTLKDLAAASTSHSRSANLLSRISTPQDLPMFSGDPMDWLQFRQAYEESTQVCNFSPKENSWRLRKCLHGPAKEAVTALLITATSPDVVMATLELQFGKRNEPCATLTPLGWCLHGRVPAHLAGERTCHINLYLSKDLEEAQSEQRILAELHDEISYRFRDCKWLESDYTADYVMNDYTDD